MFMQNLNKEDNDVDCQFKNCRVAIGTLIWNLLFNVPVLYQTVFTSADYEARFFLPIHHYELQFNRFNPEKSLRSVRTADYLGEKSVWVVKQESHWTKSKEACNNPSLKVWDRFQFPYTVQPLCILVSNSVNASFW